MIEYNEIQVEKHYPVVRIYEHRISNDKRYYYKNKKVPT